MEKEGRNNIAPSVDFSEQISLDKNIVQVESDIYQSLKVIAQEVDDNEHYPIGSIIVLARFESFGPRVDGMVQMKPKQSPIESHITISSRYIKQFSSTPYDGAIIVDKFGQIIGAGIYLIIDKPTLEIPDGCGTRHKAAASFSLRNDVNSVLTISEETNIVRIWKDGQILSAFRGTKEDRMETKE